MNRDRVIRKALLIRAVEERLLDLFAQGKLAGTVHTSIGQEFCASVVSEHLRPQDAVFSNHRCHGHFLSVTLDTAGLIAEVMGREAGVCGGRGGSQHLCCEGFLSTGILGGALPIAAGAALARKWAGRGDIAVAFIGDGTLGEGVFYETLNLASLWKVPLLLVLEDNGYAQSTAQRMAMAGSIAGRAEAFGIEVARGDTWHWEHLWETAGQAVESVRARSRPLLLVVDTYRLRAHSKGDDDRDPAEVRKFEARDPLTRLLAAGDRDILAMAEDARRVVDDAAGKAAASPYPVRPAGDGGDPYGPMSWRPMVPNRTRFVDALRDALGCCMRQNDRLILLGEDIESPYGGAFKVTRGLSAEHPDRVFNSPISEAAIVGVGTGLALAGYLPLVEIMFGDFTALAADQIVNQASKLPFLFGPRQRRIDLVIRTPMGGRRGYGPTHSQTLDRLFIGTPGLRVIALNSLVDPHSVLDAISAGGCGPTLMIENKSLYARQISGTVPDGFQLEISDDPFPVARVHAGRRSDVTLLGYGGMCDEMLASCERLFQDHDVLAQVICPTQIYPLQLTPLLDVLSETPAVVVVEEGQGFAGFGAEVLAQLVERRSNLRTSRVVPCESPIAASPALEATMLPGEDDIVAAANRALGR